jgi:Uma2 family endonuclease
MYQTDGNLALAPTWDEKHVYWEPLRRPKQQPKPQKKEHLYTFAEFEKLQLPEDCRYELRGGKIYMMGAPALPHIEIAQNIYDAIHDFLKDKPCRVFSTGLGVRLKPREDKSDKDQFVPDIVVVCDRKKLQHSGCEGAPDLVVEVLSPSTASTDRDEKRHAYEDAGVREYWIVSPYEETVETFVLENGVFKQDCFSVKPDGTETSVPVSIFPGFSIPLSGIFPE